jgi:hypothetical protein
VVILRRHVKAANVAAINEYICLLGSFVAIGTVLHLDFASVGNAEVVLAAFPGASNGAGGGGNDADDDHREEKLAQVAHIHSEANW